jgi:hypothetical protein
MFAGTARSGPDHVRLKRLGDEVERALPHAFNGQLNGGERGEQHHSYCGVDLPRTGQDVQPFAVGHLLVGDHGVIAIDSQISNGLRNAGGLRHRVPVHSEIRG